jgi:hypothetical protein
MAKATKQRSGFTAEGRKKATIARNAIQQGWPKRGTKTFSQRIGDRRYDEPGMVVTFKAEGAHGGPSW